MRVVALDHIQLAMPAGRESEARAFYGNLLGLTEVPKPARLATRGGLWFEQPDLKVHLGIDPGFRPARKAHPAFLVDDLPALRARLAEAGYNSIDGDRGDNAYVDNPFGNRIELLAQPDDPRE